MLFHKKLCECFMLQRQTIGPLGAQKALHLYGDSVTSTWMLNFDIRANIGH